MATRQPIDNKPPVIGWHDSHGASVALLSPDGEILYASAEERFTGRKLQKGEPRLAMADMADRHDASSAARCYTDLSLLPKIARHANLQWHSWRNQRNSVHSPRSLAATFLRRAGQGRWNGVQGESGANAANQTPSYDDTQGRTSYNALCEHHTAHACSAYYLSGFERAVVVTVDGVGDCLSATISRGENGRLKRTKQFFYNECTVGADYETITALLGFNPDRHCGKVTGLAAYGRPNDACRRAVSFILDQSWRRGRRNYFDRMHGTNSDTVIADLRATRAGQLGAFSKEDIACAIQSIAEDRILGLIREHISNFSQTDIALAGGVFANVRINQKIKELGFRNIFIQPAMDDTGLSLGAALHWIASNGTLRPRKLEHVFLGPAYDDDRIADALDRAGVEGTLPHDMAHTVARLLKDRKVVARFDGAMEFGPRALGNRSILCATQDPSINDWLNRRLRRTEFMPFAPATLSHLADRYYENIGGCEHAAQFMTITCDCTREMKEQSPAVVHVDGTARPQLVSEKSNRGLWAILQEYHGMTGIGSVVNTSFNMHESPIVNTPEDAIKAFQQSELDYLAIGPYLVARESSQSVRREKTETVKSPTFVSVPA